jgi:hypothetical protein
LVSQYLNDHRPLAELTATAELHVNKNPGSPSTGFTKYGRLQWVYAAVRFKKIFVDIEGA